ncbi:glycoside hydrolase domain-containing protein [Metabacillus herbersteinensis]|uniref:Glycoside hydrolase domain-containing protein n=1 Tax=Metabacillus herbersteinensis TaxID=283816 RepID=A0ABV6GAI5_9BACI
MARKVWGVDSTNKVNPELYNCVTKKLGTPKFWGRYLTEIQNVSSGLTKMEISYIRSKGMKVLPIYNVLSNAVGYEQAQVAGRNAVFHARRLGIPNNIALFASIENFFQVDAAWVRGWVETIYPTGYRPGFYHDPVEGNFANAYCEAVQQNNEVANQGILWSAEPETGVCSERKAPKYKPATPNCNGNVWVWQYGRDAVTCPVDTNLADERVLAYLY